MTDPRPTTPPRASAPRLLNLGCGVRRDARWTNLDLVPAGPEVQVADLRRGIPFPDGQFDAVYHAHLLEHFSRVGGLILLRECGRVLRPGGVLRVVVPDLETIARLYLDALDRAAKGDPRAAADHEWLLLELYDQTMREQPGGAMAEYLRRAVLTNEAFVLARLGAEGRAIRYRNSTQSLAAARGSGPGIFRRLARFLREPEYRRERLARLFLGSDGYAAYRLGQFRRRGEVHLWMYDRHSLAMALVAAGFEQVRQVGPRESAIPGWPEYELDADATGQPHKPDSLYVEAMWPGPGTV